MHFGDLFIGFIAGAYLTGWAVYVLIDYRNKPKLYPFLISLNGYKFTLMAAKLTRGKEWLEYHDDRGALLVAFPAEHFPEAPPDPK